MAVQGSHRLRMAKYPHLQAIVIDGVGPYMKATLEEAPANIASNGTAAVYKRLRQTGVHEGP